MEIEKLISNIVNEAVKKSDLVTFLSNKFSSESPKFNSLDPETKSNHTFAIVEAYKNIKSKLRASNPATFNFLQRHDGNHGSNLITIEQLNKITEIPFKQLMDLLSTVGDFKPLVSDDSSKVLGDDDETRRIAGELAAACRMGYLSGPGDPEAAFLAQVIHLFGGRVLEF